MASTNRLTGLPVYRQLPNFLFWGICGHNVALANLTPVPEFSLVHPGLLDFLCVVMELVVVEEKKLVPAVVRAVTVLDELAASPEPLSFTDLVKRLGMPKSSLYGLCTTLLDLHLIRKLENGSFTLGTHVMGWANAFLSQLDLTQEFFAAWDDMRVLPEETITLSILDGENVVYIACRNGTRPTGVHLPGRDAFARGVYRHRQGYARDLARAGSGTGFEPFLARAANGTWPTQQR